MKPVTGYILGYVNWTVKGLEIGRLVLANFEGGICAFTAYFE